MLVVSQIALLLFVGLGERASKTVLIVTASGADVRVELTREALAYWESIFMDLGLAPVLGEPMVRVEPQPRPFENYARRIWLGAGRGDPGSFEPPPPAEVTELEADIVLLLSSQPLMPFAWPLPGDDRYFVAVRTLEADDEAARLAFRNVIAHELGHVVGLGHGRDVTALMCMPCDRFPGPQPPAIRELSADSRRRLVELWAPAE